MSKRILLMMVVVILCNSVSVAHNKKKEYDKLVDYVNMVYVKSYVERKIQQKRSGFPAGYKNEYNANIKGKWEKAINKRDPLKLVNLLSDLSGHQNATLLCNIIDGKKKKFKDDWTKTEIIECLLELPKNKPNINSQGFFGFLEEATKELKDSLKKQIPDNFFETSKNIERSSPEKEVNNNERANVKPNADRKPFSINELWSKGKSKIPVGKIIFVVLLVVLGYFLYNKREYIKTLSIRFNSNSVKAEGFDEVYYKKKISDLELENKRLVGFEKENAQLRIMNKKLELLKIELERRIKEFDWQNKQNALLSKGQSQSAIVGKGEGQVAFNDTHLYANAIIDGRFYQVTEQPNDDTVYELIWVPSAHMAMFGIYREAYRRVIKNPDFVDGCDKQKINDQPQALEIENGKAVVDDLGKWKVTKKAKIKFV